MRRGIGLSRNGSLRLYRRPCLKAGSSRCPLELFFMLSLGLEEDSMFLESKIRRPCNLFKSFSSEIIFTKNGFNLAKCPTYDLVYVENFVSASELKKCILSNLVIILPF